MYFEQRSPAGVVMVAERLSTKINSPCSNLKAISEWTQRTRTKLRVDFNGVGFYTKLQEMSKEIQNSGNFPDDKTDQKVIGMKHKRTMFKFEDDKWVGSKNTYETKGWLHWGEGRLHQTTGNVQCSKTQRIFQEKRELAKKLLGWISVFLSCSSRSKYELKQYITRNDFIKWGGQLFNFPCSSCKRPRLN